MENKIKKSFKPGVPDDQVNEYGITSFCSWERLKPYIEQACALKERDNEEIASIIANKDGIKIIFNYK